MSGIRVMLVDDHRIVIDGLRSLLSEYPDIDVVATARSADEALERYGAAHPDVVLMDLSMPSIDGVEATRRLRAVDPEACVIILTGFVDERAVAGVVDAGAIGYLLKSVSGDELVGAIKSAVGGNASFSREALITLSDRSAPPHDRGLTARELEVLDEVADGRSNKEIAVALGLSPGTVRIHVSNILAKLDVPNRTAAALLARDEHLVERSDPARRAGNDAERGG